MNFYNMNMIIYSTKCYRVPTDVKMCKSFDQDIYVAV